MKEKAFTLIELIVTLVISSIILSGVVVILQAVMTHVGANKSTQSHASGNTVEVLAVRNAMFRIYKDFTSLKGYVADKYANDCSKTSILTIDTSDELSLDGTKILPGVANVTVKATRGRSGATIKYNSVTHDNSTTFKAWCGGSTDSDGVFDNLDTLYFFEISLKMKNFDEPFYIVVHPHAIYKIQTPPS